MRGTFGVEHLAKTYPWIYNAFINLIDESNRLDEHLSKVEFWFDNETDKIFCAPKKEYSKALGDWELCYNSIERCWDRII